MPSSRAARSIRQRRSGYVSTGSSEASWPQYSNNGRGWKLRRPGPDDEGEDNCEGENAGAGERDGARESKSEDADEGEGVGVDVDVGRANAMASSTATGYPPSRENSGR